MMLALTLLLALTTQVEIELSLTDGSTQSGRLEALSSDQVVIDQNGQRRSYAASELQRVRFSNTAAPTDVAGQAILTDGSRLALGSFRCQGDNVTIASREGAPSVTFPRRALQAVQLMTLDAGLLPSLTALLQNRPQADVVVIRRKDGRLQQVEGIVGDIDDARVKFQFEGDWIDVQRDRIAGLVFATPTAAKQGIPRAQLSLADGTELQVLRLAVSGGQLQLSTPSEVAFTIPFDQIRQLDFAALSTVYLSDVELESSQVAPYLRVPALIEADEKWFQPQLDRRLSREPLALPIDGSERTFDKGLGLHSRTKLVYRLAGKYRRFLALAAVDDTGGSGRLTLVISADDKEVFRQTLSQGQSALEIEVDLSGANRMQIVVDYADQSDQGDQLSLCDARLIK